jgi:hypothetical protein
LKPDFKDHLTGAPKVADEQLSFMDGSISERKLK